MLENLSGGNVRRLFDNLSIFKHNKSHKVDGNTLNTFLSSTNSFKLETEIESF